jgi:hypothetical protein
MVKLFSVSIAAALGLAAAMIGLNQSVALLKFWWGVRGSLGILRGDLLFFTWIAFQTVLYLALTTLGVGLVTLRSKARVPAVLLLYCDAVIKLIAPPVTRTDVLLAAASILVASVLVTGFGRRLYMSH